MIKTVCHRTIYKFHAATTIQLPLAAATHNSIRHAAAAARNLDAAIPLRSAEPELQKTIELRMRLHN